MPLNSSGQTQLSEACLDNDIERVRKIISEKHDSPCEENWNCSLALHIAVKFSSLDIVKLVLKATPEEYHHTSNHYGQSVYGYALVRGEDKRDKDAPSIPELLESKPNVLELLKIHGIG